MNSNSQPPSLNNTTSFIIIIALLGISTWFFNHVLEDMQNPNQHPIISTNNTGIEEIKLQQNRYSHYVASGKINGQPVTFFVDTGATLVAIPGHIAKQLNLKKGATFQTETANGKSQSHLTMLDSISLGHIQMTNVPASINEGMEFNQILLGMSFLKHLHLTQHGKQLTIRLPDQGLNY